MYGVQVDTSNIDWVGLLEAFWGVAAARFPFRGFPATNQSQFTGEHEEGSFPGAPEKNWSIKRHFEAQGLLNFQPYFSASGFHHQRRMRLDNICNSYLLLLEGCARGFADNSINICRLPRVGGMQITYLGGGKEFVVHVYPQNPLLWSIIRLPI